MDFISISRKHSFWSSFAHTLLNILLVAVAWFSIFITKTPWFAIGLVIFSKWRTFAVRPRFWLMNVKSNLVDLIFSLGIVLLMWANGVDYLFSQALFLVIYFLWILIIKPKSGKNIILTQSLFAVFFGFSALFAISYNWPSEIVVLLAFAIGYASIRHVASNGKVKNFETISLFWALIMAQIAWLLNYMVTAIILKSGIFSFSIPHASIVFTVLSYASFETLLAINSKKSQIQKAPIVFAVSVILVILVFFLRVKA